jgi:hypothetical protein
MANNPIEPAHVVEVVYHEDGWVESAWDPTAERWRAECACGWAGDWRDDPVLAEADGEDHREVAVGPDDALDRLVSELLDLQDDLARAVMWLAEHWSADLPVPYWRGDNRGDQAGVEVAVYCRDAEALERVARLLRVPLIDDETADSRGNRYRRAVRDFGKVHIGAFRWLPPGCTVCGAEVEGDTCATCGQRVDARAVTMEVA